MPCDVNGVLVPWHGPCLVYTAAALQVLNGRFSLLVEIQIRFCALLACRGPPRRPFCASSAVATKKFLKAASEKYVLYKNVGSKGAGAMKNLKNHLVLRIVGI